MAATIQQIADGWFYDPAIWNDLGATRYPVFCFNPGAENYFIYAGVNSADDLSAVFGAGVHFLIEDSISGNDGSHLSTNCIFYDGLDVNEVYASDLIPNPYESGPAQISVQRIPTVGEEIDYNGFVLWGPFSHHTRRLLTGGMITMGRS